ncbi:nocturnin-like [Xenia sp. Carnegie-2017]|uniref:nocturnin-like n=1 Tax=Xenia sp. Carnegie-2017 TaxID=2897299 RepID=UPI001F03B409|nr:nocturnin-like [Xenia sp. Carnegie-2017]
MQWNILADALSYSTPTKNFVKCTPNILKWPDRQQRILHDALLYSPDLLCLQEVDHFEDYFAPQLEMRGYVGSFAPKPNSVCLRVPGHNSPDGCALFVKSNNFEINKIKKIILKDGKGVISNQVALLAIVTRRRCNSRLLVAVTHLKAKEGNEKLRLEQGRDLLSQIKQMKSAEGNDAVPLVVCGDFNASAGEPVYQEMEEIGLLSSAYKSSTNSEAPYTTWKFRPKEEVCHTIDYVWHSSELVPRHFLAIPSKDVIGAAALPSVEFPSDHLPLLFDFEILGK